jgi:hypothetical protein
MHRKWPRSGPVFVLLVACSSEGSGGNSGSDGGTPAGGSGGSAVGASGSAGSSGTGDASGGSAGSGGAGGSSGTSVTDVHCSQPSDALCYCVQGLDPPANPTSICTAASINGLCCSDLLCACRRWTCTEDADGCECGPGSTGASSLCTRSWTTCCRNQDGPASTCLCDDSGLPCDSPSVQVDNCDVADTPCGPGETRLDSCQG